MTTLSEDEIVNARKVILSAFDGLDADDWALVEAYFANNQKDHSTPIQVEMWRARERLAAQFATRLGMKIGYRRSSTFLSGSQSFDHPEWLVRDGDRKQTAALVHNYCDAAPPPFDDYSTVQLPRSWYFPDECTAFLIVRNDHALRLLSEGVA